MTSYLICRRCSTACSYATAEVARAKSYDRDGYLAIVCHACAGGASDAARGERAISVDAMRRAQRVAKRLATRAAAAHDRWLATRGVTHAS